MGRADIVWLSREGLLRRNKTETGKLILSPGMEPAKAIHRKKRNPYYEIIKVLYSRQSTNTTSKSNGSFFHNMLTFH